MVIKRFQNAVEKTIKGKRKETTEPEEASSDDQSPEAAAIRGVKSFCEASIGAEAGDEVLHLPVIVEAAESSPQAAAAAAVQIRKYLSKDNLTRPQVQYNAIMLIRILADNPGPSFTKNLDSKFAQTVKELLRNSRDQNVQQITRETLSALYQEKAYDTNLSTLFAMWTKEVPNQPRPQVTSAPRTMHAPLFDPRQPPNVMGFGHPGPRRRESSNRGGLPAPAELAARIEEAKTSAKLLQQLVQSTSPAELQANDLIKEFSQRVAAAQRSIQGYINADDPPPDEDTLQTLIETSEQLSLAASKHQRAVLQARRLHGPITPPIASNRIEGPILATPALPARQPQPGMPQQYSQPSQSPYSQPMSNNTQQDNNYIAPQGPPPARRYADDDEDGLYSPPSAGPRSYSNDQAPRYPPTSLSSSVDANNPPVLPPVAMDRNPIDAPATQQSAQPGHENPFADEHAASHYTYPSQNVR